MRALSPSRGPARALSIDRSHASAVRHPHVSWTAGALSGVGGWAPVGASGEHEFTRFDLVRFDFEKQMECDNGRREMHSDAPFGLTVWGWGTKATEPGFKSTYVSYAYPAGASVLPINDVIVRPTPG